MTEVYFTQGIYAGETKELHREAFGLLRDHEGYRWVYVLRDDGWMQLFWHGTIKQFREQSVKKALFFEIAPNNARKVYGRLK